MTYGFAYKLPPTKTSISKNNRIPKFYNKILIISHRRIIRILIKPTHSPKTSQLQHEDDSFQIPKQWTTSTYKMAGLPRIKSQSKVKTQSYNPIQTMAGLQLSHTSQPRHLMDIHQKEHHTSSQLEWNSSHNSTKKTQILFDITKTQTSMSSSGELAQW